MQIDLQTLAGILTRGKELVNMLQSSSPAELKSILEGISAGDRRLGKMVMAVSALSDHLLVLGACNIEVK